MIEARHVYHLIEKKCAYLGKNKQNELIRLVYDICRRDRINPQEIIPTELMRSGDFFQMKAHLLNKRFPSLTDEERGQIPALTPVPFSWGYPAEKNFFMQMFQKIFFEKDVAGSALVKTLKENLPKASFEEIDSYRNYCKQRKFTITDYNQRRSMLFVIRERFDFFLHCPCSKESQPCGYHIMNAGMGCGFDCVYCYLQGYINAPGLVLPGNLEEILSQFPKYYRPGMRLGTGQFTDSLFLDDLTGFSKQIIAYFKNFPDLTFEFKTKSDCIRNIVTVPSPGNIIISWSVNPAHLVEMLEYGSASLDQRLRAAHRCAQAGYQVGFHFDPIIYSEGWEAPYLQVVKKIFDVVPDHAIAWISLGCLRMTLKVRQIMEERFPQTLILDAEQIVGYDGKIRYPKRIRRKIYQTMLDAIQCHSQQVPVYLCMEDAGLNNEFGIQPFDACSR